MSILEKFEIELVTMANFEIHYSLWLDDCKQELKEKGLGNEDVDICENGQIYFGNLFITEKEYVTPWEKSRHFII